MARLRLSDRSDEELLECATGDADAFGVFYDRYERRMLAFLMRATGRADVAADLTAEVFAAALVGLPRFDREFGTAANWLFGIARHQVADLWERGQVENRARQRLGIEPLALTDEFLERVDELGSGEMAVRLLQELPVDQRQAVHGRVVEERDYRELAEGLRCSESVVRQRVSRGLRALRKAMETP